MRVRPSGLCLKKNKGTAMRSPMRFRRTIHLGWAVAGFSSMSYAALPTPQFDTTATSSVSFSGSCNQGQSSASGASSTCLTQSNGGIGRATSGATAGGARASAYATADVFTPNANFASTQGAGNASAHVNDYVQFSGAANSQALLSGTIVVHGGLTGAAGGSAISNSSANASYQAIGAFFGQNFSQSGSLHTSADGANNNTNNINGTPVPVSVLLNFDNQGLSQLGSFSMSLTVNADGFARGFPGASQTPGSASAASMFGQTMYWGGVSSIADLSGQPILGVTSISSSGFNYMTSAVPEPTTAVLMGMGLLGLGAFRRRRPT